MEEYEVKFLDIDPGEIEAKLKSIKAKKQFDRLYRVKIFDYPGFPLNEQAAWVRLRDEGDKITLTYKRRLGITEHDGVVDKSGATNDEGMKEVEVVVDNFEATSEFLYSIGMVDKFTEEKRRIRYLFEDIEFDIDYMPGLKPFLEIESVSMARVEVGIKMLGLNTDEKRIFSAFQIYKLNGIDMLEYESLTFKGLKKRRKK